MKKILLTGGSGFIGRNILESSLNSRYEIVAPSSAKLNIVDTQSVDDFFRDKTFDVVLHSAIKPAHRNAKDPAGILYANLRMFENLTRYQSRYGKFIHFGSGAVYDVSANNSGVSEETMFRYLGRDELSFCKYVIAKRIESMPHFVNLNIFGIFGKYEDYSIRFISNAICKSLFGRPISLRQNRRFSYLDVNDLIPILDFFIAGVPAYRSYNIVPDHFVELEQLARLVQKAGGGKVPVEIASPGYGLDYYGDNSRLKNEFSTVKFTPIGESVRRLFDYYAGVKDSLHGENLLIDK